MDGTKLQANAREYFDVSLDHDLVPDFISETFVGVFSVAISLPQMKQLEDRVDLGHEVIQSLEEIMAGDSAFATVLNAFGGGEWLISAAKVDVAQVCI